jgi:hypothetical protein
MTKAIVGYSVRRVTLGLSRSMLNLHGKNVKVVNLVLKVEKDVEEM